VDDGGSTPSNGTTPTEGPRYRSVTILQQPVNASFQGLKPDLTGLIIEVEESNGNKFTAKYDDSPNDFSTVPDYCDTAFLNQSTTGDNTTNGQGSSIYVGQNNQSLNLVYKGQVVPTPSPVSPPMVVPADYFYRTGDTAVEWYSDTRPDYTGLTFNVTFDTDWKGLGRNSIAGKPNQTFNKTVEGSAAFPPTYFSKAASEQKLIVYLGKLDPATVENAQKGSRADATNLVSNVVPVKYYGVLDVKLASADWQVYFDDDLDVNGEQQFYTSGNVDAQKIFAALKKSNAKFEVSYKEPNGGKAAKTNTWDADQYLANNAWYYNLSKGSQVTDITMYKDMVVGDDGKTWLRNDMDFQSYGSPTNSLTQGATSVLWYGRDEAYPDSWKVRLNYIPWRFNNSADYTQFDVAIPIYQFAEDVKAIDIGSNRVTIYGKDDEASINPDEFKGISDRWYLEAKYTLGKVTTTKKIGITSTMLYAGYYGASIEQGGSQSGWAGLNGQFGDTGLLSVPGTGDLTVWHPNISASGYASVGTSEAAVAIPNGQFRREFSLPIWYRGINLSEEDNGIIVDLQATAGTR